MRHGGSRSTQGPGASRSWFWVQTGDLPPLSWHAQQLLFDKVPSKSTAEAPEPHRAPPFGPSGPMGQGIGCPASSNIYEEQIKQLFVLSTPLHSEWPWLHGSFRIWGPESWPTPTKLGAPCNFCFIKFSPKHNVAAPEAPCTPFTHPVPGGGSTGLKPPKNLPPPLRTISMPNLIQICPAVRISIENTHT